MVYFSIDYYLLLSKLRVINYNRLVLIIVAGNRFSVEYRVNIMSSRYMTGTWLVDIYFYLFICPEARAFDYQFGECAVHNLVFSF